jgi:large subunit ribosomal protein L30e
MSSRDQQLRLALSTGRVQLGSKQAERELRRGRARMAILSSNCPEKIKVSIENYGKLGKTPIWNHEKDSVDLGMLCGKPYPVSAIVINDPGDSRILELMKEEE